MRLLCQLSGQHRRKKGVPLFQSFWHYFRVGLINWRIKLSKDTDKTAYRDVTLSTPFIDPSLVWAHEGPNALIDTISNLIEPSLYICTSNFSFLAKGGFPHSHA
jgi:hypothetical protein